MSDTWSGQITFTGIGSGTDFTSIVEQLIEVESYRLVQMEDWKADWEEKQEALSDLNTALISLESNLKGMDTVKEFMTKTASSTDSSAVSVSADADADEDSHTVVVNQLAANDVWVNYATSYADPSDVITTSNASISLTYAGESYTIDVPAGTTLESLASIINQDADLDGGLRATVITDGDEYYLQLRGMDLGADNTITIDSSTVPGFDPGNFVNTQAACDCQVKVDDFPPGAGNYIELDTNVLTDVIPGVTLTLKDTTGASGVRIDVATDEDQIVENVQSFVDQINTVREMIQEITAYDSEEETGSVLTGNYGVQMVDQDMKEVLSSLGLGFLPYDSDTGQGDLYSSLSQVGISTDSDENSPTFGMLLLDEDELREALAEDPDGVAELFSAECKGDSRSPDLTVVSTVPGITEAGTYDVSYTASNGSLTSAFINGYAASVNGNIFTAMEGPAKGLVLRADDLSDGTHDCEASVKRGKIGQLVDKLEQLTDPLEGTLTIIEDNYQNIIDNLDDKIDWETDRLLLKQQRLQNRFARLEATLIVYEGVESELESAIASLDS